MQTMQTMPNFDLRVLPISVQQRSVEKLRSAILAGIFKPGDKLVEAELCSLLGVSRPSVREALRSLEGERLIEIIPNHGPQIPVLTWEQAAQIYNVRKLLEGEAAALAARRRSDEDIKALRSALSAFRATVRAKDAGGEIAATTTLYAHLFRISGNKIIEETLLTLLARINFLRGRSMSMPGRATISLKEMKAIIDAIEAKDSEAARRAAVYHVTQACDSARQSYKRE
jgi:DNA-binding GntR family transcriptional regulator